MWRVLVAVSTMSWSWYQDSQWDDLRDAESRERQLIAAGEIVRIRFVRSA